MTAQDFGNFFPLLSSGSSDSNSMSSQLEQDLTHMSSCKEAFLGGRRGMMTNLERMEMAGWR
jgi:hypothetical protein